MVATPEYAPFTIAAVAGFSAATGLVSGMPVYRRIGGAAFGALTLLLANVPFVASYFFPVFAPESLVIIVPLVIGLAFLPLCDVTAIRLACGSFSTISAARYILLVIAMSLSLTLVWTFGAFLCTNFLDILDNAWSGITNIFQFGSIIDDAFEDGGAKALVIPAAATACAVVLMTGGLLSRKALKSKCKDQTGW